MALQQPLFRREGIDQRFKTGLEASEMLLLEAHRKDPHSEEFLEVYMTSSCTCVRINSCNQFSDTLWISCVAAVLCEQSLL
jgi:hypothetical protein